MTNNRKALRITNGSVIFTKPLLRFGKKNKRQTQSKNWEKLHKQFNPKEYKEYMGAKSV